MKAIGQLAGGIAHDFNNLLTIILGYADLLLLGMDRNDPPYKNITQIDDAAKLAESLTRQLLAFSRKQVLQPSVAALYQTISNSENMMQRLIGEGIVLTTNLDRDTSKIKADEGQIEQVILNIDGWHFCRKFVSLFAISQPNSCSSRLKLYFSNFPWPNLATFLIHAHNVRFQGKLPMPFRWVWLFNPCKKRKPLSRLSLCYFYADTILLGTLGHIFINHGIAVICHFFEVFAAFFVVLQPLLDGFLALFRQTGRLAQEGVEHQLVLLKGAHHHIKTVIEGHLVHLGHLL